MLFSLLFVCCIHKLSKLFHVYVFKHQGKAKIIILALQELTGPLELKQEILKQK